MTRAELAAFWNEQLDLWLRNEPLARALEEWKGAYVGNRPGGERQEWAFPEPWMGDILGSTRIVLGGLNPGGAHADLQSRDGGSAKKIGEIGFTRWAAPRPYNIAGGEWTQNGHAPIELDQRRLWFARSFLNDETVDFGDVLTVELYPWHSRGLRGSIRVKPSTLREFILEPLREFIDPDIPIVVFGRDWAHALDAAPELAELVETLDGFVYPQRKARLYRLHDGGRVLVEWHPNWCRLPEARDVELLRAAWFRRRPAMPDDPDASHEARTSAGFRTMESRLIPRLVDERFDVRKNQNGKYFPVYQYGRTPSIAEVQLRADGTEFLWLRTPNAASDGLFTITRNQTWKGGNCEVTEETIDACIGVVLHAARMQS